MTEKTLKQDRRKADNARHWTEQAQQPASEPMTWRDCLREKGPKAQNPEAGTLAEEARVWSQNPEPASTAKGKVSGRQTGWILAALLIGLPLVLLLLWPLVETILFWGFLAVLAMFVPAGIVFIVRGLAHTEDSSSSIVDDDDEEHLNSLSLDQRNPYNW